MAETLTIWTFDWVSEPPRGYVRDFRLRWAAEELELPYRIETVPFDGRETGLLAQQPFGQVPILADGDIVLFESGAGVLHLARKSEKLMPADPLGEAETLQWVFAALNTVELLTVPWGFLNRTAGLPVNGLTERLDARLAQMERVLAQREWLAAGRFTVADLLMADVLRHHDLRARGPRPATEAYLDRITSRPAFAKAQADQLAHFAKADATRQSAPT